MHISVLLKETIENLLTDPDGIYVDCTLGGGGHSKALADRLGAKGRIIALDKDKEVMNKTFSRLNLTNLTAVHADFINLQAVLSQINITTVAGIMLDLGVSSFQLDQRERGFSFHEDAPLDMRMNQEQIETAADLINNLAAEEITDILFRYGEEKYARSIAKAIVAYRENKQPIGTTLELVEIIKAAVPAHYKREKHPARRTFQAIRIALNREMEALEAVLPQAVEVLKPGGRLCVISFHSLEDRIVKRFMQDKARTCICPPHSPICVCNHKAELKLIKRKAIAPTKEEIIANPRARTAKLRVAEKI